ncbi:MAG: hypothetical protein ACFFCS_19290 [Candidatus Hodarchaeota archaeon]
MKNNVIKEKIGQRASLIGVARNAKGGAVLVTENDGPIYIIGLESWPDDTLGKTVRMEGILKEEKLIPDPVVDDDGAISQGAVGMQLVLYESKILEKG